MPTGSRASVSSFRTLFHRAMANWPLNLEQRAEGAQDRKSTRLNSSHANISYAVFCLKKKKQQFDAINAQLLTVALTVERHIGREMFEQVLHYHEREIYSWLTPTVHAVRSATLHDDLE